MELRQRIELRTLMGPELRQSLKILTLPLPDLKALVEEELVNNPFLDEMPKTLTTPPRSQHQPKKGDLDFRLSLLTKKASLQDVLLRQLSMFTNTDEELKIGQEIIGNIDENGYLKVTLEEISLSLGIPLQDAQNVLGLIQQFEPAGVGARTAQECLLIQLKEAAQDDPLTVNIIELHLADVAKKNYSLIAKGLKESLEKVEASVKKILKLDPKPGRDYSQDETQTITPDIIIEEKDGDLEITINDEDIPGLSLNKEYKGLVKKNTLEPQAKEFLKEKLRVALELVRSLSRRKRTLRKVVDLIVEIQSEAIKENLSCLKPLTFKEVADKLALHETTVCRVVMNKYVQAPFGIVALKDFFPSHLHCQNGESVSSNFVKSRIQELISQEDKKHPLSDRKIVVILENEDDLKVARRTVAKYREELKILSTAFRRVK